MVKDFRYAFAKLRIETEGIKSIATVFEPVPPTVFRKDLGLNHSKFTKFINNPSLFTFQEIKALAVLLDIDPKLLIDQVYKEMQAKEKKK
jgi:hypothetical protein